MMYADPSHQPWRIDAGTTRALLIPGFMGTPQEMRPLGEALAAAGVGAASPLLPGFGPDVGRLAEVSVDDWVGEARAAWQATRSGAERSVLVGFSMGGAVALLLAAEAPPDALILLAPHWRFAQRLGALLPVARYVVRELRPFANADFSDPDIRRTFAAMAPDADLDDPATQAALRRQATLPTSALAHLGRVGTLAGRAAPRVRARTSLLQGSEDTTSLPSNTRLLATRLGGPITLHEVPGGHHLVLPEHRSWPVTRDLVVRAALGEVAP